jgi:DNA polymerase III delta prime subunit
LDNTFKTALHTLINIDQLNLLFIGDIGSGKTTLLHILIHEYYGLDKTEVIPMNEILFVNNLKEQGIHYFRNEMKTFCQSRSSIYGKKKMVIIDDIDNINEQSQQVFRNYIDKYKHNVNFITVCTNLHKVIESLQSRLHIIKIPIKTNEYTELVMNNIIDNEKINIDAESKRYLLLISGLSIRTLINYLEKMHIYNNPISIYNCKQLCSNIHFLYFDEYINKIKQNNLVDAIDIIYNIYDYGYSVIDILDYMFIYIKIIENIDDTIKYQVVQLLCKYITIFNNVHEDCIELALFTNNMHSLIYK